MNLQTISTGSVGNCYILTADNGEKLIIDAGVPTSKIKKALNYDISKVVGVLVTHSHKDHSLSVKDLSKMGLKIINPCEDKQMRRIVDMWKISAFPLPHNGCENYGFLIDVYGKRILYLTDFEYCKYTFDIFKVDYILVECNYQQKYIDRFQANYKHKVAGHCEIETTKKFLQANATEKLRNVIVIHLGEQSCDKNEVKAEIENVVNCQVNIAYANTIIELGDQVNEQFAET